MAIGVGEIYILDALQFTKPDTADVWTQDAVITSSVRQETIHIPTSYKAARVIFNGNYDSNGGRMHGRVKATLITSITTPTKTAVTQMMEWTAITPAVTASAIVESSEVDCSASWSTDVHIDICQSSTTANTTGIEIIVQGRTEDALNEWTDIKRFTALAIAAAAKQVAVSGESTGTTVLVTAPVAGGLDNLGKLIFIEDTVTIAQCEIAFLTECGTDA